MATLFETQSPQRVSPWSINWIGRSLLLVPEAVLLPLLFGLYVALNRSLAVAVIGELVFVWFVARTVCLWLAHRAWHAGRYRRAAWLVRWSLRLYPWSADGWTLQSSIHLAQGTLESAITAAHRAIELFPQYPYFQLVLSYAYTANHQWQEARHAAMTALAYDDTAPAVHAQIAHLSGLMHESPSVVQQWVDAGLNATTDAPTKVQLYLARAEAAATSKQERLATVALEQATGLLADCAVPVRSAALYRMGRVYQQLKQNDAARAAFEQIEALDAEGCWLHAAWRAKVETHGA